jgi:hypothetical protein
MMMQLLGQTRAVRLFLVLFVLGLLVAAYVLYVMLQQTEAANELSTVQAEVADLTSRVQNIKAELKELQEKIPLYERVKQSGLFQKQDRFFLEKRLEELRAQTAVIGFAYEVAPQEIRTTEKLDVINKHLVNSRITLSKVDFLFDTDLYQLISVLDQGMPGSARLHSLSLGKKDEINKVFLDNLKNKISVTPFNATVVIDWTTVDDKPPAPAPADGSVTP